MVTFIGALHPYQVSAVEQMIDRQNMLVAFDMGTGKTVLTVAAIEALMDRGEVREPGIVIALSSLKYQWADAIHQFSDSKALVIDGTPKQRAAQYAMAMDWRSSGVDWVILNYETVVIDWDAVSSLPHGFLVVDEATAIKGFRSKRSKRVKKLAASTPIRYALTGTPAENGKPEELFSIFQFVDSGLLGDFRRFDQKYIVRNPFGGVQRYTRMDELHAKIKPAMVRKRQTDPDVAPFMPATIEPDPILVSMPLASRKVYQRVADDLLEALDDAIDLGVTGSFNVMAHYGLGAPTSMGKDAGQLLGRVGARLVALRQFCCDSTLLIDSETEYAQSLRDDGVFGRGLGSPKLNVVCRYVGDHLEADDRNKVVIFTHWVKMVDRLVEQFYGSGAVAYTGQMDAKHKEAAKREFQDSPNVRVLVSSDAGGYGVDLPQANMLVNYDLADTAGADAQRRARIKRASSTWPTIKIQDFLIKGSIEERMRDALVQKAGVQAAVVDGEGISKDGGLLLSLGSLSRFLRDTPSLV